MKTMSSDVSFARALQQHSIYRVMRFIVMALSLMGVVACGAGEDVTGEGEVLGTRGDALDTDHELEILNSSTGRAVRNERGTDGSPVLNGLSVNGLSVNGLSVNGLSVNGLSVNGLSVNGLQNANFQSWFDADPATRDMVMKYVVVCAVPQGQARSYTSSVTGVTYTWQGLFGLAPGWSAGSPATVAEQQLITACLAAHANKFGLHISLSILGKTATGSTIPYTTTELATYSEPEACFFGNAFTEEGVFAANNRNYLLASESSPRACGLSALTSSTDCPPLVHVGACQDYCTLDPTRTFYTSCTYNGVTYQPLTTRMRPVDIFRCGDGVCQFTESCGTSNTYNSCKSDCGECF